MSADQAAIVEGLSEPGQPDVPFWRAPYEFMVHGIVGTLIFAIVAGVAVVLDYAVQRLEKPVSITIHGWHGNFTASHFVILGLKGATIALFVTDLVLFVVFLWRTARRTMKVL